MRTFPDRVRHAVAFEIVGLAIFTPAAAFLFERPVEHMGVIGVVSATAATLWNFVYNLMFDKSMLRFTGGVAKTIPIRIVHTVLFEGGLVIILIPFIAAYLDISLFTALLMDVAIVAFYLVYAFFFNLAYDRIFPVPAHPPL